MVSATPSGPRHRLFGCQHRGDYSRRAGRAGEKSGALGKPWDVDLPRPRAAAVTGSLRPDDEIDPIERSWYKIAGFPPAAGYLLYLVN